MSNFNKCCVDEIKKTWEEFGLNLYYTKFCATCNHYIGLTPTTQQDAEKLLQSFNLAFPKIRISGKLFGLKS
jgi:hypothetical protein